MKYLHLELYLIFICSQTTPFNVEAQRQIIRLSHHINTKASEYFPCVNTTGNKIYFSGMDRSGFFEIKVDFTKTRNSGGEDIFVSDLENGIWTDARPVQSLNTNAHEVVTHLMINGSLLLTGNYQENLGPTNTSNGSATPDLFMAVPTQKDFRIIHFEEPVNSIFFESDAWISDDEKVLMFVSDRPGRVGDFHKKGWNWNESTWGNTDIWFSVKDGLEWSIPLNAGSKINTPFTERTPWLSPDGKKLFISSNGHNNRKDLDIFYFTRSNKSDWEKWEGPFPVKDLNSEADEWGYKESAGNGFFARSLKIGFTPTNRYREGAGTPFENNFRSGYTVNGAQSGSFKADEQTDIFMVLDKDKPNTVLNDVYFDLNKSSINSNQIEALDRLIDLIKINNPAKILIEGHTDSSGPEELNIKLSKQRAESIKSKLIESGVEGSNIETKGLGSARPANKSNASKNRRVEIYFR